MCWRHTQTEAKFMFRTYLIGKGLRNTDTGFPLRCYWKSNKKAELTSLLFGEPSAVCVLRRLQLPVVGLQCREGGREARVPAAHLPSSREIICCCWEERSWEPSRRCCCHHNAPDKSIPYTLPLLACCWPTTLVTPNLIQGLTCHSRLSLLSKDHSFTVAKMPASNSPLSGFYIGEGQYIADNRIYVLPRYLENIELTAYLC